MDLNAVRAKEHLGITTSETTIDRFNFFVTPLMSQMRVENGAYVLVDHPVLGDGCPVLAQVTEMKNYEEVVGTTLGENKSIRIMALGETIGYIDLRQPGIRPLRKLTVPLNPGSKVYLPYFEFLEDLFTRSLDGTPFTHSLHVGQLESSAHSGKNAFRQLQFYVDAEDFMDQHILITALTGAGKTHTAAVLVEELAQKTPYPVVILDSYGEYTTLGYASSHFNQLVTEGTVSSKAYPFDFQVAVYTYDADRVKAEVKKKESARPAASVSVLPIFTGAYDEKADQEIASNLRTGVRSNQVTVLDAQGLTGEERRHCFSACVKALWDSRVNQRIPSFLLVVDEAEAMEGPWLARIASEGRKRGCMMCLLSQHPTQIESRVLSQVSTHVVGRLTGAQDLEYFSRLFIDPRILVALRRGEWIVTGVTQRHQTKVLVRDRYSPQGSATMSKADYV